jgi:ribosomal protein S18 acetylase RimI-like enzyme
MSLRIIDFNTDYLNEAALLLQNAQKKQFNLIDCPYTVSLEFCKQQISHEMAREVSGSYLVLNNNQVLGFAIASIRRDDIWGDSGWINLGAWGFDTDYINNFPFIYQKIAETWVKKNIYKHYIMIFDFEKIKMNIMTDMGFARQQTHAVLNLGLYKDTINSPDVYIYRRSNETDQAEMNGFSRLIAEYQTKSPCFASAPLKYLENLDEGFSSICRDPEIDLFVAQDGSTIAGYQGYYDTENPGFIIPPKSVELAVSCVKEEYRGKGCGLNITKMSLSEQKKRGFDFAVTDWRSANLLSGPFWKKTGFKPVAHRLFRQIDSLI